MSALLFDTLRLSRTLREKGHFTAERAETPAEALSEASHDLATKADVAQIEAKLRGRYSEMDGGRRVSDPGDPRRAGLARAHFREVRAALGQLHIAS
jgi:hypothetical protein